MIRTRQLVARTHHCVLATPRAGARILAPASSAPSPHRRDHRRCPGARGVVHSRRFFALAVSPAPPERRRAFASASAVGSETNEVIEADFTEKEKRASTATNADAGAQDQDLPPTADDYDDSATEWSVPPDWCGAAPGHAAYGRIVDSARLAAEFAYEENGAAVGALAEAAGEDGAGSRWLRGFLGLLEAGSFLPGWWHEGHREEVLRLAQRRNSGHYVKQCLDVPRLKAELGREAYNKLEEVSTKVYMCVIMVKKKGNEEEDEDDEMDDVPLESLPLSKEAVDQALRIWGKETARELFKKLPEQLLEQWNEERIEASEMFFKPEEGHWWGPASHEQPEEAYRRLIDAARLGTSLAFEQQGHFKGALIDSMKTSSTANGSNLESHFNPQGLGDNAISHFGQFLGELKGDNPSKADTMPEWWDNNHENALWKLAANKDGGHFLGSAMIMPVMKKTYNRGVLKKIEELAKVAMQAGESLSDVPFKPAEQQVEDRSHKSDKHSDHNGQGCKSELPKVVGDSLPDTSNSAAYAKMTIAQLKEELRKRDLRVGGRKADLVARLVGQGAVDGTADYSRRTVAWLKDELRSRGLRVGGTKAELIARLQLP